MIFIQWRNDGVIVLLEIKVTLLILDIYIHTRRLYLVENNEIKIDEDIKHVNYRYSSCSKFLVIKSK